MKKYFFTLFLSLLAFSQVFAQEITIFFSESKGEIVEMIVRYGEVSVLVDAEGEIKRVHIGQPMLAGMHRSHKLGRASIYQFIQDGINFSSSGLSEKSHFDFYYQSRRNGKISSLNEKDIDYYDYHYTTLKNGKLKRVGDVDFDYNDPHYQTLKKGKIKTIGQTEFDWHEPHYQTHFKGKISEIGDIEIEYYNSSYQAQKGKVESIGNIELEYIEHARLESLKGKFKSISGTDDRFMLRIIP